MEEIKLNQVDVTKLNVKENDILMVTVKSNIVEPEHLNQLKGAFKHFFPNNQVLLLSVEDTGDIKFSTVSMPTVEVTPPSANFCNDCGCGKKEAYENYHG